MALPIRPRWFYIAIFMSVCVGVLFFAKPIQAQEPPSDPNPLPEIVLNEPPLMQAENATGASAMRMETALAVTNVVSPANRQESFDFFWSQYEMTTTPPISWTGTYSPCNPGATSSEFKEAVAQRINYFRAMAGVPATITFSDTLSALDQEAALIMSVNNSLSHTPPITWTCYTTNGYTAAGNSNLAKGTGGLGYGWNAINGYMSDWGTNNYYVGHRRWVLYPQQQVMGTGDVPAGSGYPAANALWTDNFSGSRPPTREEFVAWPPPGYVPFRVVYPRWSFSYPNANFMSATVSMISETVPITTYLYSVYPVYGGGSYVGEETISWAPAGYNTDGSGSWPPPPAGQDMTITVMISNAIIGGVSKNFTYTVVIFNDDIIAPTGGITIANGAEYAGSATMLVSFPTFDYRGVTQMRFYTDTMSDWQTYYPSNWMNFGATQGQKSLSVQYRDAAGNMSDWYTDTIILDTTAPTGTILVNNGAVYAMSSTQVNLTAFDNYSLTQMNVSVNGVYQGWEPYSATRPITFAAFGTNWVYVRFMDAAGNIGGSYSDSVIADFAPPSTTGITIAGGAVTASAPAMMLTLNATDNYSLTSVNIGINGAWQGWAPYAASKSITLTGGPTVLMAAAAAPNRAEKILAPTADGNQTVNAMFRDAAGNMSVLVTDMILLDTTPPTGTISINDGATYATSTTLTLTLSATDNYTVTQMRFYYNGFWHALVPYTTSATIVITDGNTYPTVNAQFVDEAGNGSASVYDAIIIDMMPPTGSIVLNGGAAYTNLSLVTAIITAADNTSLDAMQLAYDGVLQGWEPVNTIKQNSFAGEGVHTATVQIRDGAGNVSAWYTDTIIVDTTPPDGTILVNNGATFANTTTLTLTLSATDNYTVAQMRFYYDGFWHDLQPYATTATIVVTSGNTSPAINVQFVDGAGNGSVTAIFDGIIIDMTPPTGSILLGGGAVYATTSPVIASIGASDNIALDAMQLAYDGVWQAWEPAAGSKNIPFTGDGVHTVTLRVRDGAGNISVLYTDTIILDTTPPTGTVSINLGATYTNQPTMTLYLTATDNISLTMMNISLDGVTWLGWETYAPTKTVVFAAGDGAKVANVSFRDAAGNIVNPAVFDMIILDTVTPSSTVLSLPAVVATPFAVSWAWYGTEMSGVKCYDVQSRAGLAGAWTTWQSCAAITSTDFVGDVGTTYYFRSSAIDNAGNAEAYPISPDYDASTCVDAHEPNNGSAQAAGATIGISQTNAFCLPSDVDWVKFTAQGGAKYSIAGFGITATFDLIAPDGVTVLATGVNSIPAHTFAPGVYFVRARNTSALIGRYDVLIQMTQPPRMVYAPNTQRAYSAGW